MKTFADRLKLYLYQVDINQAEFSRLTGMHVTQISHFISGRRTL